MKTVGVIGGMGPAATVDFFARVVKTTPATRDQDHLHIIVNSDPSVPDRNRALAGTGPSSGPAMADMARALERAGADFLVIACNTAHAFIDDVRQATDLPVIDMVAETVAAVRAMSPMIRKVGLLAVDGCLSARLYQRALADNGLAAARLSRPDQATFMELVYRIKAGDLGPRVKTGIVRLANRLIEDGVDILIAACTEVPLVLGTADVQCKIVSSTDILVAKTIAFAQVPVEDHTTINLGIMN